MVTLTELTFKKGEGRGKVVNSACQGKYAALSLSPYVRSQVSEQNRLIYLALSGCWLYQEKVGDFITVCWYKQNTFICLLVCEHVLPVKPVPVQSHSVFPFCKQIPPFWQGFGEHLLVAVFRKCQKYSKYDTKSELIIHFTPYFINLKNHSLSLHIGWKSLN